MLRPLYFVVVLASAITSQGASAPEFVTRGQIKLTLAGAEKVVTAAKEQASALNVAENITVVDDGGHLMAFVRMDGARPASADTAITKAVAAANMRRETGPLFKGGSSDDSIFNLAIEHASAVNVNVAKAGVTALEHAVGSKQRK